MKLQTVVFAALALASCAPSSPPSQPQLALALYTPVALPECDTPAQIEARLSNAGMAATPRIEFYGTAHPITNPPLAGYIQEWRGETGSALVRGDATMACVIGVARGKAT